MAVISCTLTRMQLPTTVDELNRGTYQLKYEVVTNSLMGHQDLTNDAQSTGPDMLPSLGATYSFQGDADASSYARAFAIESREGHQFRYLISVTYGPSEGEDPPFVQNPVLRPPIVWADRETFTRIIERDNMGKAIANKCFRQYDLMPELEDTHGVLVIEFNVGTLERVVEMQRFLRFAVNATPWTFRGVTFPSRTVLARECSSGPALTQGAFTWYRITCRFVLADGTGSLTVLGGKNWDIPILERGYQHFKANPFNPGELIKDADGNNELFQEAEPHNLADNGTKLPDGVNGIFTSWQVYREVDFNLLPFSDAKTLFTP
jgi:hypothetical protein